MDASALGSRLRHLRERAGLSQARLGQLAGCRAETIHHIERGRAPRVTVLCRVVSALGAHLEIVEGEGRDAA